MYLDNLGEIVMYGFDRLNFLLIGCSRLSWGVVDVQLENKQQKGRFVQHNLWIICQKVYIIITQEFASKSVI